MADEKKVAPVKEAAPKVAEKAPVKEEAPVTEKVASLPKGDEKLASGIVRTNY